MPPISATIITHNEAENITRAIRSLDCADEILVVDSGSTDATVPIAAGLGARAVAGLAIFVAEDTNLGGDAGGGLLEAKRHVVAQVGAALPARAASPPPSATEHLFEAKEITEDVLELLKDRRVESTGLESAAAQACLAEAIVDRALLWIRQDTIGLARSSKILLGFRLFLRVAIGMPLERSFAIRRLDLIGGSVARDTEHFVIIRLTICRHRSSSNSSS